MKRLLCLLLGACAGLSLHADVRVTDAEAAAIKATALDYIEGWYTGDAARMEGSLHPDLAKRTPVTDAQGHVRIQHMGALALVQATRAGHGTKTPADRRIAEVTIQEVEGRVAIAKLVSADFTDWFQMVNTGTRWQIVNVLWTFRSKPAAP
jgi:hypothetical protein